MSDLKKRIISELTEDEVRSDKDLFSLILDSLSTDEIKDLVKKNDLGGEIAEELGNDNLMDIIGDEAMKEYVLGEMTTESLIEVIKEDNKVHAYATHDWESVYYVSINKEISHSNDGHATIIVFEEGI